MVRKRVDVRRMYAWKGPRIALITSKVLFILKSEKLCHVFSETSHICFFSYTIHKLIHYVPSFYCSYRFTQIAVDPQVKVPGGKSYDVLFIGTGNGTVFNENRYGMYSL